MTNPTDVVSVRELYSVLDDKFKELSSELKERDRENWARIMQMKSETDATNNLFTIRHDKEIEALNKEIYGKGEDRGLRVRMTDLERNTGIAHGLQATLTTAAALIAGWWGTKN